jgi:hypothetical protein
MKIPRGYLIRTFRPRYEHAFMNLMALMDFDDWTSQKLDYNLARILPEGWFFALDAQTVVSRIEIRDAQGFQFGRLLANALHAFASINSSQSSICVMR